MKAVRRLNKPTIGNVSTNKREEKARIEIEKRETQTAQESTLLKPGKIKRNKKGQEENNNGNRLRTSKHHKQTTKGGLEERDVSDDLAGLSLGI